METSAIVLNFNDVLLQLHTVDNEWISCCYTNKSMLCIDTWEFVLQYPHSTFDHVWDKCSYKHEMGRDFQNNLGSQFLTKQKFLCRIGSLCINIIGYICACVVLVETCKYRAACVCYIWTCRGEIEKIST